MQNNNGSVNGVNGVNGSTPVSTYVNHQNEGFDFKYLIAKVVVNGQNANKIQSGTTETDMLHQLILFSQETDVNNELQQLHARTLIEQTMHDLQYNVSYWAQGDIRFAESYKKSPF